MSKEECQLIHNMSAPSSSIISFAGSNPLQTADNDNSSPSPFKRSKKRRLKPIAFRVQEPVMKYTAEQILNFIGEFDIEQTQEKLIELIDKRAQELTIPDGCAVIKHETHHEQVWTDLLAQLAVICKSSSYVWLRAKSTKLYQLQECQNVSLVVPATVNGE